MTHSPIDVEAIRKLSGELPDAFERRDIVSFQLCERVIRSLHACTDEIDNLRAALADSRVRMREVCAAFRVDVIDRREMALEEAARCMERYYTTNSENVPRAAAIRALKDKKENNNG